MKVHRDRLRPWASCAHGVARPNALHLLDVGEADAVEARDALENRADALGAREGERAAAGPVGLADAVGLGATS